MGAVVGVYFAIRSAKGLRERAFVWRVSGVGFVWMAAILVTMWYFPLSGRVLFWLPSMTAMPFLIRRLNRRQEQIRMEEVGRITSQSDPSIGHDS